jgi:(2Fe-2S) ferredoxin
MSRYQHHIFVCENLREEGHEKGSCAAKGSMDLRQALKKSIKAKGLRGTVRANAAGCLDACEFGPSIVVYPEAIWYGGVQLGDLDEIIDSHIVGGKPVERLRIQDPRYTHSLTHE